LTGDRLQKLWADCGYSLLAGCAPCQPFSTYSRKVRKKSKDPQDERWVLVKDFARLVREANPDLVTIENVPQLIDHPVFGELLDALSNYNVWYDVIECASYGVPQTRKRLVLLASLFGPISLLPARTAGRGPTVRATIRHLPHIAAGESDPDDPLHCACKLSPLNLRRIRASVPGGTWRQWPTDLLAECHLKPSGATYPSVYGRMGWDEPAPTMTTQCFGYGNGRFGHPEQDRAITLREAALLQTFPKSYRFIPPGERPSFYGLGRLIGNAVPVRIGEVVAKSFVNHLGKMQALPRGRKWRKERKVFAKP
jgi:DNA (cytosine-5)-methyltransferase 1